MIPSPEAIARWYEAGLSLETFDRRCLLPAVQLASAVRAECDREVSEDDLQKFASDGWYATLPLTTDQSARGVPLFIPSRIGLMLDLRDHGSSANELRSFAAWEEFWIDNFREIDLDYLDDDLEILLRHHRERLASAEAQVELSTEPANIEEARKGLEQAKAQISLLETLRSKSLNPTQQENIKRAAFSVRAIEECLRLSFVEQDRAKCRAGFSCFVSFRAFESSSSVGFVFRNLDWPMTLSSPWIEEWSVPIRVPEFSLDGDRITTLRPLIPSAYKRAWEERHIDSYFDSLARLRNETRCLHCRSVLPAVRSPRQRYCSDGRGAAKQRRLRENNPDSVFNAQSKYYRSLADDDNEHS
jgi:hypothetical protein